MRYTLTALLAASLLVVPVTAQAATGSGSVDASSSATSLKAMKSTLRKDLKRGVKGVRKLDIATIEAKGMTLKRVRALVAGKGSFTATGVRPAAAGQSTPAKRVTVARRSRTFPRRGKSNVKLKLTQSGKKLLQVSDRVTLTVKATFRPRTGGRISVSYRVTLKRKFVPQSTPITPVPGTPGAWRSVPARGLRSDSGERHTALRSGLRRTRSVARHRLGVPVRPDRAAGHRGC